MSSTLVYNIVSAPNNSDTTTSAFTEDEGYVSKTICEPLISSGRIPKINSLPLYPFSSNNFCFANGNCKDKPLPFEITPSCNVTLKKFIAGDPINPATNTLFGVL